jgi:RNA polymerase sigma factor (sigma-70 family)
MTKEKTPEKKTHDALQQEKRLIEWMRNDLHAGFSQVVVVYQRHLLWVANGVLRDTPRLAHLAEDVVQDGLLNAFKYLATHPEMLEDQPVGKRLKLKAWLTKIVQNQAIACLKTGEAHIIINAGLLGEEVEEEIEEGYATHYDDPALSFERQENMIERLKSIKEAKRKTRQVLSSLPHEQRVAVERMYLAPLNPGEKKITYEQAAEALGKPVGTIKSQVSRAMKQMRKQLTEQPDVKKSQQRKLS